MVLDFGLITNLKSKIDAASRDRAVELQAHFFLKRAVYFLLAASVSQKLAGEQEEKRPPWLFKELGIYTGLTQQKQFCSTVNVQGYNVVHLNPYASTLNDAVSARSNPL